MQLHCQSHWSLIDMILLWHTLKKVCLLNTGGWLRRNDKWREVHYKDHLWSKWWQIRLTEPEGYLQQIFATNVPYSSIYSGMKMWCITTQKRVITAHGSQVAWTLKWKCQINRQLTKYYHYLHYKVKPLSSTKKKKKNFPPHVVSCSLFFSIPTHKPLSNICEWIWGMVVVW